MKNLIPAQIIRFSHSWFQKPGAPKPAEATAMKVSSHREEAANAGGGIRPNHLIVDDEGRRCREPCYEALLEGSRWLHPSSQPSLGA